MTVYSLGEKKKDFDNLLNIIFSSSNDLLENKLANQNRLMLDGTQVKFILTDNDKSRTIYAYSPCKTSHPLLTTLIRETMNIYRQTKNNNFLNTQRTSGY